MSGWICPKCGSGDGVWIRVRVTGFRLYAVDGEGEKEFANDDELMEQPRDPKSGECQKCGAAVRVPTGGGA